uniref:Cysteine desulfurase n=1 Tax=uncultured Nocardioidaceae bacterium TaxID=253824 RepID=A0A6J4LTP6_9ACTN|nr:MAG: Cysteine desulfurase [uncultured Nocardioidaceae bacterium]
MTGTLTIEQARAEFAAAPGYLNTASLGLPPERSWNALQSDLQQWRTGFADPRGYDKGVAEARRTYARLVGVDVASVAVGSQVSALVGMVAASLPDGSEVLTADGDFTSVLFPFVAQEQRGITVRVVPLEAIADEVRESTTVVSVSAVQSADGRVADLDALEEASARTGARVLLDITQAAGWLPVDASRFAYTVCGGYKWLLAARGAAYLTVQPDLLDSIVPHAAGWYAGDEPWTSIYGVPLRLAPDARRLDVSPVWLAWVTAAPSLQLLASVGMPVVHEHSVGLANRCRKRLGLPGTDSAIVSVAVADGAATALVEAGVVGAMRAGRLRLAFHLCNDDRDVDLVVSALDGLSVHS